MKLRDRKWSLGLQTKLLLLIFPILISSLFISDIISRKIFYNSMTLSGQKFALYKADQLEKYSSGQWQILVQNEFFDRDIYWNAAKDSISSYLEDLISSEDEIIFSIDKKGNVAISSGLTELSPVEQNSLSGYFSEQTEGWIEVYLSGEVWIGHSFYFSPFQWQYFLLEREASFYSEIDRITFIENTIILILSLIAVLLVLIFVHYLLRPLKRVTTGIRYISNSRKFDRKVDVEFPDEIGELAHEFNIMTSSMDQMYERLRDVALSEAMARKEVTIREMETLETLSSAAEYKDPETGAHTQRVGEYARMVGRLLGGDDDSLNILRYAAPLHDIGKIGIGDRILLKPGKLDEDEFTIMKTHAEIGYNILKNSRSKYLREGADIAYSHHERFNGGGYPRGLSGEDIPLGGRIVCVVDVFDALVSLRPYKQPWSFDKAAQLLLSEKGKQFDPEIVDLFLKNFSEVQDIFRAHQDE